MFNAPRRPGRPVGTTKKASEKMTRILACVRPDQKDWLESALGPHNFSEWIRGKIDQEMEDHLLE